MWLYYLLKSMSWIISHLPYKLVVKIGLGLGRLYYIIAKKQRIRAEETIKERLGYSDEQAKATIRSLFIKLGATFMEIMYMPALNKNNIRGLVTFDRPDVLWEALGEGKGVVMLACHMDNWEWLGAALALSGFPLSAVEKPQPNHIYSDFMNELRKGVGQEIFSRGTSEILGCARAMKKNACWVLLPTRTAATTVFLFRSSAKWLQRRPGLLIFSRKFNAPIVPIFIVRKEGNYGHLAIVKAPIYYEDTGDRKADDYNVTLKMTQIVEEVIKEYPDNWLWFQHRWNTPYTPPEERS